MRQEEFTLPVATITEGLSLQGKFYSFRGALKRAVEKGSRETFADAAYARNSRALAWAEATICWVDRKHVPSVVKFCHKDQHPTSALLRRLLATRAPSPLNELVKQKLAESAKRMLEEQGKAPEKEEEEPKGGRNYG